MKTFKGSVLELYLIIGRSSVKLAALDILGYRDVVIASTVPGLLSISEDADVVFTDIGLEFALMAAYRAGIVRGMEDLLAGTYNLARIPLALHEGYSDARPGTCTRAPAHYESYPGRDRGGETFSITTDYNQEAA